MLFTLPEGFRPAHRHRYPVLSKGKLGVLEIEAGGNVVLVKGSQEDLSLDGLVITEDRPE